MITHPEKVLFPADGITKGELAAYYEAVAPFLVPYIKARPVTMERFPAGIDRKGFLQKDVSKGFPAWLQRVEVPKKGGTVHYPLVTDTRSLLWVVNQNTLTPHVWISRAPKLNYPDVCVFDLDPTEDEKPEVLRAAALALRRLLEDELGLPSWVKTSGSKGFHIVVPLDGKADMGAVARFTHAVGTLLVQRGRRSPRRARGRRSSKARPVRSRSRCGRWPRAWPTWAICGRTCASAGGRSRGRWPCCGGCSAAVVVILKSVRSTKYLKDELAVLFSISQGSPQLRVSPEDPRANP